MLENKLHFEDNMATMARISDGTVDLILQDPNYGVTDCHWDTSIDLAALWSEWLRIAKKNAAIVFTTQQPFTTDVINSQRKLFRYERIWDKVSITGFLNAKRMPLRRHENILVFYRGLPKYFPQKVQAETIFRTKYRGCGTPVYKKFKRQVSVDDGRRYPSSIIRFSVPQNNAHTRQNHYHNTQKPLSLWQELIQTYTEPGDLVFDGYGGSATTAIACHRLHRRWIVSEKDPDIYAVAKERLEAELCQLQLFDLKFVKRDRISTPRPKGYVAGIQEKTRD